MKDKLKAFLFDLDGTLIETVNEISDATNDTLRALGESAVLETQVRHWIGHGTRELLVSALADAKKLSITEIRSWPKLTEAFHTFDEFYLTRCGTRSHLYPLVREILDEIKATKIKMAIVTNKETRFTTALLKAHKLEQYFDIVICGDTLNAKKPDPRGIHFCLDQFKAKPDEVIFIGDSSIDAKSAQNAGVTVWLMPYGYNMGEPLENSNPDRIAIGFRDLLDVLN